MTFFFRHHPRIILVTGDEGFMLVSIRDGNATIFFAATDDDVAQKRIAEHIHQYPDAKMTILANHAAQDFRSETLPPVNVLDRAKLVQKRIRQAFPNAFASAHRRLDAGHEFIACLHNAMCPIPDAEATYGLLPVEAVDIIKILHPETPTGWVMLLAVFRTGGLRQVVIHNGQLVFTRQTPTPHGDEFVEIVRRVIADSRAYLARFGLDDATVLKVIAIIDEAQKPALQLQDLTVYSPAQMAARLGLADAGKFHDVDVVFAMWIAGQRRLWLPLLPPVLKEKQQQALIARVGTYIAYVVLLVAVTLTGWNLSQLVTQSYKNYRAATSVELVRNQVHAKQSMMAPSGQPLGRLRTALERQRLFAEPQNPAWYALQQVGQGINPAARVQRFEWRDDHVLQVTLRLNGMKSDDREATVHAYKILAEQMQQAMPQYDVVIARYPFPATPQETLSNQDSTANADDATADFVVRRRP